MNETKYSVYDDGSVTFRYWDPQNTAVFDVDIHCPLTSRLHTQYALIMERHRAWARSFQIPPGKERFRNYCDTRLDLLSSYQCCDLSLDAAVIHSHLMTWFFVFDDIMDIDHGLEGEAKSYTSELCKKHLAILNGAQPGEAEPGCIHAFYDFVRKVGHLGGTKFAYWYERMKYHLREYVLGAYWESLIGPTTEVNTNTALYLQVRHMAVGVAPCLDLMAMAAGIAEGRLFSDNFFIQRLERLAINYSIWINDLAGFNRDMKKRLGNVIFTLQQDHHLSIADATRMLARMCDGELDAFFVLEKQLPLLLGREYEKNSTIYDAYVGVMKRWMRGLLDWSVRSERYQRLDTDMALQDKASIRKAAKIRLPE